MIKSTNKNPLMLIKPIRDDCATKLVFWTREDADRRRPFGVDRRARAFAVLLGR